MTRGGRAQYLLLRDVIPREAVEAGAARIIAEMARGGWWAEGSDPSQRVARASGPTPAGPDTSFAATNPAMLRPHEARAVTNDNDEVLRVLEAPEVYALLAQVFGEDAVTMDYKWFRAISPPLDGEVHGSFHVDKVYMGRGTPRLTTVWIPWHDIEPEDGGLAVLAGSSALPGFSTLRDTYAEHDVSYVRHKTVRSAGTDSSFGVVTLTSRPLREGRTALTRRSCCSWTRRRAGSAPSTARGMSCSSA